MKRNTLFFAPDDSATGGASPAPTPATPTPATNPVSAAPSAPAAAPTPEPPVSATPKVPKQPRLSPKVLTPDQIPGSSTSDSGEAAKKIIEEARAKRKGPDGRDPTTGKFVPSSPAPSGPAPRVADAPSTPAAPAPEAPVAPPVLAAPKKILVAGKEYTEQELADKLNAPVPAAPPAPAAPGGLSPEDEALEVGRRRTKWVDDQSERIELDPIDEVTLNAILDGGAGAVEAFNKLRRRDAARAILETRMSIEQDVNPLFQEIHALLQPVLGREKAIAEFEIISDFATRHQELVPHEKTARQVADTLMRNYGEDVAKMSPGQFVDEIARQTEVILNARAAAFGYDNWRKLTPAQQQQSVAAPQVAVPAATPPAPAPVPSNRPTSASPSKANFQAAAANRLR